MEKGLPSHKVKRLRCGLGVKRDSYLYSREHAQTMCHVGQVWRTRAMLMGVFASLFKVCFSFIYRYECFKTLSYTFIYFLLLLLYCYFISFYLDYSDRSGS